MRQIILDTETTGLEVEKKHRVIEIGCVELLHRRITGRVFHQYLNPERDIDPGAQQVHGLSRERLSSEPRFAEIVGPFLDFIAGAELIIHNAPFDLGFLNAELSRLSPPAAALESVCAVVDTLVLARRMHPGQRNSLDALCKRYGIDNSHRDYHGALLDARILAEVYLAMTGGQAKLTLGVEADGSAESRAGGLYRYAPGDGAAPSRIPVVGASAAELSAHEQILTLLDKASGGNTVWRKA